MKCYDLVHSLSMDQLHIIAMKLAENHPVDFIEALDDAVPDTDEVKYVQLLKDEKYVGAISLYRQNNNSSLKDAKDYIDDLRERLVVAGCI